ncbi:MAG: IS1 family transposase [Methylobacter sp.]|nr:IS1 family transposase [Methylobacter sp.]
MMLKVILAFVFGMRKEEVFKQLNALLQPFNITRYYTDDWGAYERHTTLPSMRLARETPRK